MNVDQNQQPDIAAQVQALTAQNNQLQGQLLQLLTNSTIQNAEKKKPDAFIVLVEADAAACPVTGRTLPIPDDISRQAIKFVIEQEWDHITEAFTRNGGFRDLKQEYNFVGCVLLFAEEDNVNFIHGAAQGLWTEIVANFNSIPTVVSLPTAANQCGTLLTVREENPNFSCLTTSQTKALPKNYAAY